MKYANASITLATLFVTGMMGCRSAPPPAALPPRAPVFTVPAGRAESSAALADINAQLSATIGQFPGDSLDDHRKVLVSTLSDLSKALRLANGPVESPEFVNRIAVIDAARTTATTDDLPRARMEAVETQAIQAASAALSEIKTRYLFDDDQLPPMLEALNADVIKASNTVGPLHDVDATHAFRSIETVMQRVSDDMSERFGGAGASTPPPPSPAP